MVKIHYLHFNTREMLFHRRLEQTKTQGLKSHLSVIEILNGWLYQHQFHWMTLVETASGGLPSLMLPTFKKRPYELTRGIYLELLRSQLAVSKVMDAGVALRKNHLGPDILGFLETPSGHSY